jgi:SAM-dependent methyltransferase
MHFRLFECRGCHFLYSVQGPEPDELRRRYFEADFDSPREAKYAAQTYWKQIKKRKLDASSVLDVGAGEGSFLELCIMNGSKLVKGCEPSQSAIDHASQVVRDSIVLGTFESEKPEPVFSLVTLFQTIEHIANPRDFLDFAQSSLVNGGTVAIACHNYRDPLNRLLGKKSPIFDIEHLQLFSPKSIGRLLSQAGFKEVTVRRYWNNYPVSYLLKLSPVVSKLLSSESSVNKVLESLVLPVRLGNLFVTGKK